MLHRSLLAAALCFGVSLLSLAAQAPYPHWPETIPGRWSEERANEWYARLGG